MTVTSLSGGFSTDFTLKIFSVFLQKYETIELRFRQRVLDYINSMDVSTENEIHRLRKEIDLRDKALNAISEAVLITDPSLPDNPIIYVNQAFLTMTGYPLEEV